MGSKGRVELVVVDGEEIEVPLNQEIIFEII